MLVLFFIAQLVFLYSGGSSLLLTFEKGLFVPLLVCVGRARAHLLMFVAPCSDSPRGAMTFSAGVVMSSRQWHHLHTAVLLANEHPPLDLYN